MKRFILLFGVLTGMWSQNIDGSLVNRALKFNEDGIVKACAVPQIAGKDSFSIQFWINPEKWNENAGIISIDGVNNSEAAGNIKEVGNKKGGFSVKLGKGADGNEIRFESMGRGFSVASPEMKEGEWCQVSLICDKGEAVVLINGEERGRGHLGPVDFSEESTLTLGGGYKGMIDELRIWKKPLDGNMKEFDYFINNTLNKWCPMWDDLVVYYKMDNPLGLENQRLGIGDGVMFVEAENEGLPYLINAAYTNNDRFYDCLIPRDQYFLHNELIILGTDPFAEDGRIETKTPNNHALSLMGVEFLPEFEDRKGVVALDGQEESGILLPENTVKDTGEFTFETWIYIDKDSSKEPLFGLNKGGEVIALWLGGSEDDTKLFLDFNGKRYESENLPLKKGEWTHLAFVSDNLKPAFYLNGEEYAVEESAGPEAPAALAEGIWIGKGLKGKLDETVIWNKVWDEEDIRDHQSYIPLPAIDRHVRKEDMRKVGGYYRYDNAEDLGHSYHSQDEWLNIMKGAYEGYKGVKFYISVQGTYRVREQFGDWREILLDPAKRKRFVEDLSAISSNYNGVELDLEWLENPEEWENFGILCMEIKEGLPEDKIFRVSLHNNYSAFPADKMKYVDGFTFQQYGPNPKNFSYANFKENVKKFEKNFDKSKIMTSYATTTSRGVNGTPPSGVRFGMLEEYVPGEQDIDTYSNGEETWSFTGPIQVYRRAKFTRENGLEGIFYWDMGNDHWEGNEHNPVMPEFNLAKYSSYGINANLEPDL